MKQMIIEGNKKLSGIIEIGGAKNSAVALIPAAILAKGNYIVNEWQNLFVKCDSFSQTL